MSSIQLEKEQNDAVLAIEQWFRKTSSEQRFILAGLAGTGKTTIVKYIVDKLNLKPDQVAYCAYTGKASLVLTQKGTPATTIHKLMYEVKENPDGSIYFIKKDELDRQIKIIVVDEASMVGKDIQKDLESYKIPILYVGDHGQLPPVGDEMNNLMTKPHIKLEKIHRQAENNPIIMLAKIARLGAKLPFRTWGDSCAKISKRDVTAALLTSVEQILCGKNKTRQSLNQTLRKIYNRDYSPFPMGNDKIIMLRNNQQKGFINGLTGLLTSDPFEFDKEVYAKEEDWWRYPDGTLAMNFQSDFGEYFNNVPFDVRLFENAEIKPDFQNRCIEPIDFAYAITVHKAQGSQYNSVLVYEEHLGDSRAHAKWLYTAITRAVNSLIIVQ